MRLDSVGVEPKRDTGYLTDAVATSYAWPDGRVGDACMLRRGKSGLPWAGCQVTPGRVLARERWSTTDSATENTPPTW